MFSCEVCQKAFTQKGNMKAHMKLHTENRPIYKCSTCERSFGHKSNYTKHLLQHKDPKFTPSTLRRRPHSKSKLKMAILPKMDKVNEIDSVSDHGDTVVVKNGEIVAKSAKMKKSVASVEVSNAETMTENGVIKIIIQCTSPSVREREKNNENISDSETSLVEMKKTDDEEETLDVKPDVEEGNLAEAKVTIEEVECVPVDFSNIEITQAENIADVADIIEGTYTEIIETSAKDSEGLETTINLVENVTVAGENVTVFLPDV